MAIVKNKLPHIKAVSHNPDPANVKPHEATQTLVLKPLINVLNEEQSELWAKMSDRTVDKKTKKPKGHPDILAMLDQGQLIDMSEFSKLAGELPKNLKGLDIRMASEFAEGVLDLDVLKAWLRAESRDQVVGVLTAHIEVVEGLNAKAA